MQVDTVPNKGTRFYFDLPLPLGGAWLLNDRSPADRAPICRPMMYPLILQGCTVVEEDSLTSQLLADLFDERVRQHPDRDLVVFGGRRWTYAEVADQANALAASLREPGPGAGVRRWPSTCPAVRSGSSGFWRRRASAPSRSDRSGGKVSRVAVPTPPRGRSGGLDSGTVPGNRLPRAVRRTAAGPAGPELRGACGFERPVARQPGVCVFGASGQGPSRPDQPRGGQLPRKFPWRSSTRRAPWVSRRVSCCRTRIWCATRC